MGDAKSWNKHRTQVCLQPADSVLKAATEEVPATFMSCVTLAKWFSFSLPEKLRKRDKWGQD